MADDSINSYATYRILAARVVDVSLALVFTIVLLFMVGASISEIQKRRQIDSIISNEISNIERSMASLNLSPLVQQPGSGVAYNESEFREYYEKKEYLAEINNALLLYRLSINSGNENQVEVAFNKINELIEGIEVRVYPEVKSNIDMNINYFMLYLINANSELLLLIVTVCSGALGSIFTGLRNDKPSSIKDVIIGIVAGFIIYLGIKGGKHIFIIQAGGMAEMNQYGLAFAGLIVGMNVDWANRVLVELLRTLEKRIIGSQQNPDTSAVKSGD